MTFRQRRDPSDPVEGSDRSDGHIRKSSLWPTLLIGGLLLVLALVRVGVFNPFSTGQNGAEFKSSMIEPYHGEQTAAVHEDLPFFTEEDRKQPNALFNLGEFDSFHRTTPAMGCLGMENIPGDFEIRVLDENDPLVPSGWKQAVYDEIEIGYLYLICPLIPWAAQKEIDYYENRITGTYDFYTQGLKPCLEEIRDYILETRNHVLFRATPVYEGLNLLASGVLIEAESREDGGEGFQICRYLYNVQSGIAINYLSGSSFPLE